MYTDLLGGFGLIPIGICIALFALAYSTGPWPLSHHGLGDIAVILFFGIVPVVFTCRLQTPDWTPVELSLPMGIAVGLMAANVLIVNNYRDMEDDANTGKHTTVVLLGRKTMQKIYYASGWIAMLVLTPLWSKLPGIDLIVPALYLTTHTLIWRQLIRRRGAKLNPLLGMTATELLIFAIFTLMLTVLY